MSRVLDKLNAVELGEFKHLETLQADRSRPMMQSEFNRLTYLRKVMFTNCRKNCAPGGWKVGGSCDQAGCYFSPDQPQAEDPHRDSGVIIDLPTKN